MLKSSHMQLQMGLQTETFRTIFYIVNCKPQENILFVKKKILSTTSQCFLVFETYLWKSAVINLSSQNFYYYPVL